MEDRDLLIKEYKRLGESNFKRLYKLINTNCIDKLGLGDCTNCERTPQDNPEDICINCICKTLEKLTKEKGIFKLKRK